MRFVLGALALIALGGCATAQTPAPIGPPVPTATIEAVRETEPVASHNDAADDPAIWRNASNPARSLIVATDKQAGLHVYGLDGRSRSFLPAGRVNNVDLRDLTARRPWILVAASDRADIAQAHLALFTLNPATAALTPVARLPAGAGEAYGVCLWRRAADNAVFAFVVMKSGEISQIALDLTGEAPTGRIVRTLRLATQSEGCVVDDATGQLFVGEENRGVWRFEADPTAPTTPHLFASIDGRRLTADVEGLSIAPGPGGGHLVVSSQADNAYALFSLADGAFAGRFRIGAGARTDATSETDGLDVALGDFGPDFPGGLLVVQDGDNAPGPQNFKLVAWDTVRTALSLP